MPVGKANKPRPYTTMSPLSYSPIIRRAGYRKTNLQPNHWQLRVIEVVVVDTLNERGGGMALFVLATPGDASRVLGTGCTRLPRC